MFSSLNDCVESESCSLHPAVSVPATIVTSSVPTSMGGHMMYPSPHTVMYASAPSIADGGLAVLNAFSQAPATMQVSHTQGQDSGEPIARQLLSLSTNGTEAAGSKGTMAGVATSSDFN